MGQFTDKTPAIELSTPVRFIKGCGAQRAELVARLGVVTARDLLFYCPRDDPDLTDLRRIEQLEEGLLVSVLATVEEIDLRSRGVGRSVLGVLLKQDKLHMRALWFNQPFLKDKFQRGQTLLLSGKP